MPLRCFLLFFLLFLRLPPLEAEAPEGGRVPEGPEGAEAPEGDRVPEGPEGVRAARAAVKAAS